MGEQVAALGVESSEVLDLYDGEDNEEVLKDIPQESVRDDIFAHLNYLVNYIV